MKNMKSVLATALLVTSAAASADSFQNAFGQQVTYTVSDSGKRLTTLIAAATKKALKQKPAASGCRAVSLGINPQAVKKSVFSVGIRDAAKGVKPKVSQLSDRKIKAKWLNKGELVCVVYSLNGRGHHKMSAKFDFPIRATTALYVK